VLTFEPEGHLPNWTRPHQLRHASLPSEHVCTENLTPFLKLLPCKALSGLASLLNPHQLFDANWHGMGVHVLLDPAKGIEVRLTFQSVSDPVRSSASGRRDWSFASIFGRSIEKYCPVALSSNIRIELPEDKSYTLSPDPTSIDGDIAWFDLVNRTEPFEAAMQWLSEGFFAYPLNADQQSPVPMSVQRTLRGSSQARGQLSVFLSNNWPTKMRVIYLETMPWLLQFYLHTLQIRCDDASCADAISNISYIPSVPHARPTMFQSILTIPPNGTIHLTMDVSKSFLRYTEHPPDAQRGWDLPPAVFVPLSPYQTNGRAARYPRIYTPILLVDLATPDFSMPYNVIILSCTLMTLIFGSVFNLLTRKFVVVQLEGQAEEIKSN